MNHLAPEPDQYVSFHVGVGGVSGQDPLQLKAILATGHVPAAATVREGDDAGQDPAGEESPPPKRYRRLGILIRDADAETFAHLWLGKPHARVAPQQGSDAPVSVKSLRVGYHLNCAAAAQGPHYQRLSQVLHRGGPAATVGACLD